MVQKLKKKFGLAGIEPTAELVHHCLSTGMYNSCSWSSLYSCAFNAL